MTRLRVYRTFVRAPCRRTHIEPVAQLFIIDVRCVCKPQQMEKGLTVRYAGRSNAPSLASLQTCTTRRRAASESRHQVHGHVPTLRILS
jgi:hypothetical protein